MAVNITAILDVAAALTQEGHPNSAKHLRDAVAEIERLSLSNAGANVVVPAGWQVVPVRPTMDMLAAGRVVLISSSEVWATMLAAAPQPPSDVGAASRLMTLKERADMSVATEKMDDEIASALNSFTKPEQSDSNRPSYSNDFRYTD